MASAPRMDGFTRAYFEAALWASNDESDDSGGEPLDKNYDISDIAPETRDRMIADCADFQERFAELIGSKTERAGHDFWLTRNGHGAGFWDGDWPEPDATKLDEGAKEYGETYLYVGDDGKIHGHEETRKRAVRAGRRGVAAKSRHVADFNKIDDLISHAGEEGATHYSTYANFTKVWFPLGGGKYAEAEARYEGGYWHLQGPSDRRTVGHPPPLAKTIGGRRAPRTVRDYEAVDNRDRHIAGPFKSYSDARSAAGTAGVVKFVPSRGKPSRATEVRASRDPSRSAHHPTSRRRTR